VRLTSKKAKTGWLVPIVPFHVYANPSIANHAHSRQHHAATKFAARFANRNCNANQLIVQRGATQQLFSALNVQRREGVQQIKAAAAESLRIPQASRVAATLGTFRV
jgi:hypothetical protein